MKLLPLARLKGRIEARADFQKLILKCKKSSHQCGNACVPKTKKCRTPGKLRLPEQQLTKIVHEIEDKIKDEPIEHAVVIRGYDSKGLFIVDSDSSNEVGYYKLTWNKFLLSVQTGDLLLVR